MNDPNFTEKMALLTLAGIALLALAIIAIISLKVGAMNPNASALIGVIVTGLIAVGKDIISTLRSFATSAQLGKVTDQLAVSTPPLPTDPSEPQLVEVVNEDSNPVPTETIKEQP